MQKEEDIFLKVYPKFCLKNKINYYLNFFPNDINIDKLKNSNIN